MPTLRKDRENRWMARVTIRGKQFVKMFGPGKREKERAKLWEQETKLNPPQDVLSDCNEEEQEQAYFLSWCQQFLDESRRKDHCKKVQLEKKRILEAFGQYYFDLGVVSVKAISVPVVRGFLAEIEDKHGPKVANKFLKNLKCAWRWGQEMLDDFPQVLNPFKKNMRYDAPEKERYVPPDEDFIEVFNAVQDGQDKIMFLTYFMTGARASELFGLQWSDVNFDEKKMRLKNRKGGEGHREQIRFVAIPDSLLEMLKRWQQERDCKVPHVFYQHHNDSKNGQPFTHRSHWIPDLCKKVGVKKFTLHSVRHKAASVIFREKGSLLDAQLLMGHKKASTTDRYVRSSVWYMPKEGIADALENSQIAKAMGVLGNKKAQSEVAVQIEQSNRGPVTKAEPHS